MAAPPRTSGRNAPRPARRTGNRAYFSSLIVSQICALVRYAALARILGAEQLGLAAVIVLTGQFFDSLTDAGSDRFLIQDQQGHSALAFRLVQLVAGFRGIAMAVLIIVLAGPIAEFARAPQTAEALRFFAIVPLLMGFTNYDFRAAQRDHEFLPEARVMAASELAGLIATVAAGLVLRNFTAIIYGLTARALVAVIVSHLVARRRYAVGYDGTLARRLWRFGAPLMVNGLLLFAATQSDRIIISRMLGVAELGRYSVVLLPILYPAATIMKYLATLYLPQLTGALSQTDEFSRVGRSLSGLCFALASAMSLGFAFVAPTVLPIIFGRTFVQSSAVVALVGILMSFRLIKVAPTTVAIAMGETTIAPLNNVLRLLGIVCAIVGVHLIGGLPGVVLGLIVGELVANVSATLLVNRRAGWTLKRDGGQYLLFIALCTAVLARAVAADSGFTWLMLACSIAALLMLVPYLPMAAAWFRNRAERRDIAGVMSAVPLESPDQ